MKKDSRVRVESSTVVYEMLEEYVRQKAQGELICPQK